MAFRIHIFDFVELMDASTDQIPGSGKHIYFQKRRIKTEPKF
jgi:hypothetical protein